MMKIKLIVLLLMALGLVAASDASMLVPEWDGEADTTSAFYSFVTDANPPVADTMVNEFGGVQTDLFAGDLSSGWMDPSNPYHLHRADGTGTWSLSTNGVMGFDVSFADGSLDLYTVEVVVDIIGYLGVTMLPEIDVSGSVVESGSYQFLEEMDSGFPGASWTHQVWTGTVEIADSSVLSVDVNGDPVWGSSLDRVAIYTRVVPEPAVMTLIALVGGGALAVRRIFSVGG